MSITRKEDRIIKSMRGLFEDIKKAGTLRFNGDLPPKARRRFDSIIRQAVAIHEEQSQ